MIILWPNKSLKVSKSAQKCVCAFRWQKQKVALHRLTGGGEEGGGGGAAGAMSQVSFSSRGTSTNSTTTAFKVFNCLTKLRPPFVCRSFTQCRQRGCWGRLRGGWGRGRHEKETVWQLLADVRRQPVLVCDWRTWERAGKTQQPIIWLAQHSKHNAQSVFYWACIDVSCVMWTLCVFSLGDQRSRTQRQTLTATTSVLNLKSSP